AQDLVARANRRVRRALRVADLGRDDQLSGRAIVDPELALRVGVGLDGLAGAVEATRGDVRACHALAAAIADGAAEERAARELDADVANARLPRRTRDGDVDVARVWQVAGQPHDEAPRARPERAELPQALVVRGRLGGAAARASAVDRHAGERVAARR